MTPRDCREMLDLITTCFQSFQLLFVFLGKNLICNQCTVGFIVQENSGQIETNTPLCQRLHANIRIEWKKEKQLVCDGVRKAGLLVR